MPHVSSGLLRSSMAYTRGVVWLLLLLFPTTAQDTCSLFNFEIERRMVDRLQDFLSVPKHVNSAIANYRDRGGFEYGLTAADRDAWYRFAFSVPVQEVYLAYFGLEDGTSMGYDTDFDYVYFREPGNSGYSVANPGAMGKYYQACVDFDTGEVLNCDLPPGEEYIQYACDPNDSTNCELYEPCPGQTCSVGEASCKICRKYTIETAQALPNDPESTGLGFIPDSCYCQTTLGKVTQELGQAMNYEGTGEIGDCTFGDGTLVQRSLTGDYAYCGGTVCNTTYAGAFFAEEFDARKRPWYIQARNTGVPSWTDPYLFDSNLIGITHVHPIFTQTDQGQKLHGVLAVDYTLEDFSQFLKDNYADTDTIVAIYEAQAPHYLVGSSTGTPPSNQYLASDTSVLCTEADVQKSVECVTERVRLLDLAASNNPLDDIIVAAHKAHNSAGYPVELLVVKSSDDVGASIYVSQSVLFEQENSSLRWRIIIASPGEQGTDDTITEGEPLFGALIAIATLGFLVCAYFFGYLFSKRRERAVIQADWRFTCAFILGSGILNTSTYTLLGENTDELCLARLWTFHLFFVLALAPLFVKVWRMYKLVGQPTAMIRRKTISNVTAAMYTLPIILLQAVLLLIATFVDPPKPTEIIENTDGAVLQRVVCRTDTALTYGLLLGFEAALVIAGCVLAYLQRNMGNSFGEAKQMIFAMYNIALVGTIVVVVSLVAGMDQNGEKVLQAIGVLWATVFSTAAFVIPRMMQVRQDSGTRSRVAVSGLGAVTTGDSTKDSGVIDDSAGAHAPKSQATNSSEGDVRRHSIPVNSQIFLSGEFSAAMKDSTNNEDDDHHHAETTMEEGTKAETTTTTTPTDNNSEEQPSSSMNPAMGDDEDNAGGDETQEAAPRDANATDAFTLWVNQNQQQAEG